MNYALTVTQLTDKISDLKAGDRVLLTGTVYTARDAAHERLAKIIGEDGILPFRLEGSVIFYCGPAPAKPGYAIGSCGPTTSSRMDPYTPLLLERGVKAMIGKGPRSAAVKEAMVKCGAVYLAATGGVAALLARTVRSAETVAFSDLGPEAIYRLEVVDLPLIVAGDASGGDIFK